MKWAWQQDYHDRPSSSELESVLSMSAIPHLVDAYSMQGNCYQQVLHLHEITCTHVLDMYYGAMDISVSL